MEIKYSAFKAKETCIFSIDLRLYHLAVGAIHKLHGMLLHGGQIGQLWLQALGRMDLPQANKISL